MAWTTPKTDWALTGADGSRQFFNVSDYSRIIANLQEVWNYAESIRYELNPLVAMVPLDYSGILGASVFNAVERNVELLANGTYAPPDFVNGRVFAGDGNDRTWDFNDLNRIEGLTGEIYSALGLINAASPYMGEDDFYSGELIL